MSSPQIVARYPRRDVVGNMHVNIMTKDLYPVLDHERIFSDHVNHNHNALIGPMRASNYAITPMPNRKRREREREMAWGIMSLQPYVWISGKK